MFQKKKIIEPEPLPLTTKEIKNLKSKLSEKENLSNLSIKDLTIDKIIPQRIKDVVILKMDGYHTLGLPMGMDYAKFKTWRKSNGGVFNRDVLNYLRGKPYGKYVLVEGKGERKIIRIIEDDELYVFKFLRLANGIIKDKPYMLLKNLSTDEKLTNTQRYIKENSEHKKDVEKMVIDPKVIAELENDHKSTNSSVSLFDD